MGIHSFIHSFFLSFFLSFPFLSLSFPFLFLPSFQQGEIFQVLLSLSFFLPTGSKASEARRACVLPLYLPLVAA
jgi:hypothetical protein